MRPVLLKLGGSVLTDKARGGGFRRSVARRLCAEAKKAGVPVVLLHGAGSHGHPQVLKHEIGIKPASPAAVAEVLAAVGSLHAAVVAAAEEAGLHPLSMPLHALVSSESGMLQDVPYAAILEALEEGFTPVISGTLVRAEDVGWRVVSADEWLADLAAELEPRLAVFCTDVEGVLDGDGNLIPTLGPDTTFESTTDDATGGMAGKVSRALQVAELAPVAILNGNVRGRLQQALQGRPVPATRVVL